MRSAFLLVFLVNIISYSGYSQAYLHLKTFGKPGGHRFYVGEEMRFRLNGQKNISAGYIIDFPDDSTIRFYSGYVPISEIVEVDMRSKQRSMEWNLAIAGVGYVGLEALNSQIVQGRKFQSDRGLWVPAGVLVGSAFLIHWIKPKWFRVGLRRRLLIVRVGPDP